MSKYDQFEQELPILRIRQKKELDNVQDKWILKGRTKRESFGWEEARVKSRAMA